MFIRLLNNEDMEKISGTSVANTIRAAESLANAMLMNNDKIHSLEDIDLVAEDIRKSTIKLLTDLYRCSSIEEIASKAFEIEAKKAKYERQLTDEEFKAIEQEFC